MFLPASAACRELQRGCGSARAVAGKERCAAPSEQGSLASQRERSLKDCKGSDSSWNSSQSRGLLSGWPAARRVHLAGTVSPSRPAPLIKRGGISWGAPPPAEGFSFPATIFGRRHSKFTMRLTPELTQTLQPSTNKQASNGKQLGAFTEGKNDAENWRPRLPRQVLTVRAGDWRELGRAQTQRPAIKLKKL